MSKEYLEALETIKNKFIDLFHEDIPDFDTVEDALNRLESIDNSEPSEALECLKSLDIQTRFIGILDVPSWEKYLPIIKQALLQAQEQKKEIKELHQLLGKSVSDNANLIVDKSKKEQAWDIVKENRIDIEAFYTSFIEDESDYDFYERHYGTYGTYCLTEEEFETLKRGLGE